MAPKIKVYALSTCVHCKHAKEYFEEHEIPFECVHVDFLYGEPRTEMMNAIRKINPALSFPTIVIGDKVIVGFRREEIETAIRECKQ